MNREGRNLVRRSDDFRNQDEDGVNQSGTSNQTTGCNRRRNDINPSGGDDGYQTRNGTADGQAASNPRFPGGGGMTMLPVEKLKGRVNYDSWSFAMRMVMIREGTWRAVNPPEGTQVNEDLSERALATICLSIEPYNYSLVQKANTAQEAWSSLRTAFQESGKCRKIGLLRKLMRLELEDCSSVEEYVDEVMSTSHKLGEIGFSLNDEWLSLILLMGLPKRYEPMIMGLDASGINLTADVVKSKILQDVTLDRNPCSNSSAGALAAHKKTTGKKDKSKVQCFKCEKFGHYASECQVKSKEGGKRPKQVALMTFQNPKEVSAGWILDSGAGRHMCQSKEAILDAKEVEESIYVANGTEIPATVVGHVKLIAETKGSYTDLNIANVLCVPGLATNLLSVSEICKKGFQISFTSEHCEVINASTGDVIATGRQEDGLYQLNLQGQRTTCVATISSNLELWHRRLGHLNLESIKRLPSMATGIEVKGSTIAACVPCAEGKHQKLPFYGSGTRAKELLELVHSDLCGPMEKPSLGGSKYWVTFTDDASRMTFIYFLKSKTETFDAFQEFKSFVEIQTGRKMKCLRTDNGGEYCGKQFQQFLKQQGIRHETSVPYNPEQNGLSERMNRTIEEKARCLLSDAGLEKQFWAEAASTAVYLANRSPVKGRPVTPIEAFTGIKPDLAHLRVFGAKVMAYVPKPKRKKWDRKSIPCVLVGFAECSKGYRVFNPDNNQIFISRDIIVIEENRIEVRNESSAKHQPAVLFYDDSNLREFNPEVARVDESVGSATQSESVASANIEQQHIALPPHPSRDVNLPNTRHSERERRRPGKLADYRVTYSVLPQNLLSSQQSGSRSSVVSTALRSHLKEEDVGLQQNSEHSDWERPVEGKYPCVSILSSYLPQSNNPQNPREPESFDEALDQPERDRWVEAMQSEYQALCDNGTWELVDLPRNRKALKNKWVFKLKMNADGSIDRFKARLVIKGYSQVKGVDYSDTYSPVVRYATVRYLLALAAKHDLIVHQMDAVTAFLQGELTEEEIFMEQPKGFEDERAPAKVCRLRKALYGLKQASRVWNQKLDQKLKKMGFKRSKFDTCVYHKAVDGESIIIAIYVDDFLIISSDQALVDHIKQQLCVDFKMSDLGLVQQVLGLRVTRSEGLVSIDQERYIDELLQKYNMLDCNPVNTPLDMSQRLTREMCPETEEEKKKMRNVPYRELVGGLQFIAQCTRPDISFAVSQVSSYCSNPGMAHWMATKRILRYLKGSKKMKLVYSKNGNQDFCGYSDADWGNDPDTRRSVSGYVFLQNGGAVSWSSKRQSTVALSTTEAEYMALSTATQEAMWWRGFLQELHGVNGPILIHCDNRSAISLAEREVGYSARSKHIDIRHHFVRQQLQLNAIKLEHVASKLQVADILTKAVPAPKHDEDKKLFGVL